MSLENKITQTGTKSIEMIWIRRIGAYITGLFLIALGVSFSVKSNLGVSPVNSIPYVISLAFGIDQGHMTILVFCVFILLQAILLRREFRPINLLQVLCAFLFGYFVTLSNYIVAFEAPGFYPLRLTLLLLSIVLIAMGILLYLSAKLIPQPAEGLCLAIEKKTCWKYHKVKMTFDCSVVAIASSLSFFFNGELGGVREGTVIAMFGVAWMIGILSKIKIFRKYV